MNKAEYVDNLITEQKAAGTDLQTVAWNAALACVGWAYVFGAVGEYCDIDNRRSYYAKKGAEHPTIKTACQIMMEKKSSCAGCKYFPGGKTRFFDCRGFTRWILKKVYGWTLQGSGCTSQWNNADNWTAKGAISDGIPADTLVCLFVKKGSTMEHTGFGFNNETVECSSGVQHFTSRKAKWTHWGLPKCVSGEVPTPTPTPTPTPDKRPTLRRGDKGVYVIELQNDLVRLGYGIGPCGVDGDYGRATAAAVSEFQLQHTDAQGNRLTVDGVCGPKTWAAIDAALAAMDTPPSEATYSVIISGLDLTQAQKLVENYPGARVVEGSAGA